MFGIGTTELIIILIIILIIFGAGKLPEIGSGLGRALKNFRKETTDDEKDSKGRKD
ncbi:MAG TPA: twin-arginine translocase TatA/TatE family subunit [Deltaproteobacteria bacterium]|nr:twin-arginine translocase TatA/TatE family subunit [Deltaproteobacteria bacterium]